MMASFYEIYLSRRDVQPAGRRGPAGADAVRSAKGPRQRHRARDRRPRITRLMFRERSEPLLEGTHFQFHGPGAWVLMREVPVGFGYRFGLQEVAVSEGGLQSARSRDVDAAVY